jgi:F-type H+-transporting ATPase subunit b
MIINTINFFTIISENEGFGINTDIFETNIINLSVVIGVLIYYGRAALPI